MHLLSFPYSFAHSTTNETNGKERKFFPRNSPPWRRLRPLSSLPPPAAKTLPVPPPPFLFFPSPSSLHSAILLRHCLSSLSSPACSAVFSLVGAEREKERRGREEKAIKTKKKTPDFFLPPPTSVLARRLLRERERNGGKCFARSHFASLSTLAGCAAAFCNYTPLIPAS